LLHGTVVPSVPTLKACFDFRVALWGGGKPKQAQVHHDHDEQTVTPAKASRTTSQELLKDSIGNNKGIVETLGRSALRGKSNKKVTFSSQSNKEPSSGSPTIEGKDGPDNFPQTQLLTDPPSFHTNSNIQDSDTGKNSHVVESSDEEKDTMDALNDTTATSSSKTEKISTPPNNPKTSKKKSELLPPLMNSEEGKKKSNAASKHGTDTEAVHAGKNDEEYQFALTQKIERVPGMPNDEGLSNSESDDDRNRSKHSPNVPSEKKSEAYLQKDTLNSNIIEMSSHYKPTTPSFLRDSKALGHDNDSASAKTQKTQKNIREIKGGGRIAGNVQIDGKYDRKRRHSETVATELAYINTTGATDRNETLEPLQKKEISKIQNCFVRDISSNKEVKQEFAAVDIASPQTPDASVSAKDLRKLTDEELDRMREKSSTNLKKLLESINKEVCFQNDLMEVMHSRYTQCKRFAMEQKERAEHAEKKINDMVEALNMNLKNVMQMYRR
ncbi:nucleolar and coiled-body phosphoprotein 1, partial [Reticulomyxa filosa]